MNDIIAQFALKNEVGEPQPLKIGFINDSFVLKSKVKSGISYFLQRINHHIFENVDGLQQNIMLVTDHIRTKLMKNGCQPSEIDRRVLQLVPTKDGKLYFKTSNGDYWRMYVLIENATSHDQVDEHSAYLAGRAFGDFQCQLADFPTEKLCETIPNFHNLEFRLQQLDDAVKQDVAGRVKQCESILSEIEKRKEDLCLAQRLFREGKLPKRINHCDTKVNNMLFDENGVPLCIVDLDTVMPGFVLSDYGDFMRTAANKAAEDEADLSKIQVDMSVFEAYTKGYLEKATFLTDTEKRMLPYGCRLMIYMQTVRFLTDFLNGDTYYKIQYPEHNRVRTQAQFRLLQEHERLADVLQNIVNKY